MKTPFLKHFQGFLHWSGRQDSNLLEILVFQCLLRFDNYLTTRLVLVRYHYFN
nr:MAG TPA: hypothetical protein [Caudoviricetes sp.]